MTCPHGSYNLAHCMTREEAVRAGGRWERDTVHLGPGGSMTAAHEAIAIATGELVLPAGQAPQEVSPETREEVEELARYWHRSKDALR